MDLNVRIAGEAGQGVQSAGNLLVAALAQMGLHVVATQSYMSRIRGGLNWFDVRVADGPRFAGRDRADLLVALTDPAREILGGELADGGVVLYDGASVDGTVAIDFEAAAEEAGGEKVMANTVAAGAVFALLGCDIERLCDYLGTQFKKKGDAVVEANVRCARRGAELAGEHAGRFQAPRGGDAPTTLCNGAVAIAQAAAVAGAKVVTAYPMTPSTATFTHLAAVADRFGIVVEQAEDEIAAVNMICGAAYAGAPAMATTSGGGFALMAEGLSLAGIMELPIAIVIAQRPGPATGLPTRTAQQDLAFALHAGHGEFVRAIYAPGTVAQSYDLTRRALATAHRAQTPAIVLTDQFLQDLQTNAAPLPDEPDPIDRCILTDPPAEYARYAVTDDGVSPRAIPGGPALVVCDSDEHTPDGHITEDLDAHLAQQDKRLRKFDLLAADALEPEHYGPADAEALLICWGSTYGPCREAVDALVAAGQSAAMLHFAQVWPVRIGDIARAAIARAKRIVSVEGNATGQFAALCRQQGALAECELLLRYDGLPFTADTIVSRIRP